VSGRIDKSYKDLLAQVKVQTDNFKNTVDHNQKLTQELKDEQEKTLKLKDDHDNEIKKYVRQINIMLAEKKEAAAGGARTGGALTPLILDISMGHPLWDTPVGRVVRVDLDARQVTINLGSAHGVTPELTFNIFGANLAGRAEKAMKGSIEVIKVIDPGTSLCRITSMYDGEGLPIAMHMQAQHRLTRESSFAMREGDLLFNLFWGTRVAVAGYVGITGDASSNPAEQFRQMEDFMYLLKRNGAQVDAYVDLRDGKIQGAITSKTRYLIVGDDLRAPGEKPAPEAPKMPDDDKDKDKDKEKKEEKEMAGKNGQPTLDRNEAVNRSSLQMRKEAVERGLLLISAENFATVVGYRKARSANLSTDIDFRPSLPFAGAPGERGVLVAPDRERPPEEEKKAEPEKKDNN
jgi:hypothetical protein